MKIQLAKVSVKQIIPKYGSRDENPNKMEDERFALLVAGMRSGFLQPILLRKNGKRIELVDGHHRYWGALEIGLRELDAVMISGVSEEKAIAIGFGMNTKRGETDLSMASLLMQSIQGDLTHEELSVLSGFTEAELETLLDVTDQPSEEDLLNEAATASVTDESLEKPGKLFVLEISFETKEKYKLARRRLKKAGGGDLGRGVLALLGEQED